MVEDVVAPSKGLNKGLLVESLLEGARKGRYV
jgi:hypothetical protein